ncbi:hypothetical protein [Streptosporangium vulgare]|uniref:hypothetical protein n=1 Tax=Streptosporangium vulgare TaxID=46190 RepID=UPI0031D318DA
MTFYARPVLDVGPGGRRSRRPDRHPAHADDVNLAARVQPGEEVFLTPELVPAAQYNGNVLVKLDTNSVPVKVKIANCRGRYIGTVPIAANDHAAYVAASTSRPPRASATG